LHMAKARLEAGQVDLAAKLLEHAMNNAKPDAVKTVARERLARVRLDRGDLDDALSLIDGAPSDAGFEAQFAEIRGDIYRLKGELSEAARYYSQALDALEVGTGNRSFLEIKLESSGGSTEEDGETS